jgi:apolipoprotein N-acyltransferase
MPRVFLPAIISGMLLWAAFFPLDWGALGFVALVPLLSLVRADVSRRRRYLAAYTGGFVFSVLATNWVRVAHPMMYLSWLGFSLVLPLFWVLALDFIRRLDRLGVALALAVPVAWVALEYARMHFPTGFPFLKPLGLYQMIGFGWYFLGYTQHANLWLIQIADLGGVYAVSFVVAAVNGAVADWVLRSDAVRRWLRWSPANPDHEGGGASSTPFLTVVLRPPIVGSLAALFLVVAAHAYGRAALRHAEFTAGPLVAAIQGNVSQGDKMAGGPTLIQSYARVHAAAFRCEPRPDLIVWPETCYPNSWCEVVPGAARDGMPAAFSQELAESEKEFRVYWGTHILFGLNGLEWDGARIWKYNSALLTDPHGARFDRYDKMHLVPFGEYVPLGEVLPFMHWFTPYEKEYQCRPGERWTRFPITDRAGRAFTFACLICYEDSDPYLARQYVAAEPVNFLVNISNDGWFDGTEEHEEHLAICRFRAVETRRSVVRAVNMGISAVIDPDGRVIELPRKLDEQGRPTIPSTSWSGSKKLEGVVLSAVPIDNRETVYARFGDWVAAVCWSGVLAGLIAAAFARQGRGIVT